MSESSTAHTTLKQIVTTDDLETLENELEALRADNDEAYLGSSFSQSRNSDFQLTDLGNAERFAATFKKKVRYCGPAGGWHIWDGKRWALDSSGKIMVLAGRVVRGIQIEAQKTRDKDRFAQLMSFAARSEKASNIMSMLKLAQSAPGVAVPADTLDKNQMLLNCSNGTIDLTTGDLVPHAPEDLITMLTDIEYNPEAQAPRWERYLQEVFLGDEELVEFIQRTVGYALSGSTEEQILLVNYGTHANGKSKFVETLELLLGDYVLRSSFDTFTTGNQSGSGAASSNIARMRGKRLILASEGEDGAQFAKALIKDLTGGERVSARFLYHEIFEFTPTAKIFLSTNHKPRIRGSDPAIWRRMRLVPFRARFIPGTPECDTRLMEKLKQELQGILAWAVRGCLKWQKFGLTLPKAVEDATRAYRIEEDVLQEFLTDCCDVHDDLADLKKSIYDSYKHWCEENGLKAMSAIRFIKNLIEHGMEKENVNGFQMITGCRLKLKDLGY